MDVILRQKVENLGEQGDIIRVKPGYARNYLIPKGLAVMATPSAMRILEERKQQKAVHERKAEKEAKKTAEKLSGLSLTASVQVGEEDRVFGSVTAMTISDLLKKEGIKVDKKNVLLDEPIKTLGLYTVPVKLYRDVQAEVKLYVIKE